MFHYNFKNPIEKIKSFPRATNPASLLIQIDFFGYGLATHVTRLQRSRAVFARAMTAQKSDISPSLHANTAHIRLLEIRYSRLQVSQSLQILILLSVIFVFIQITVFHLLPLDLFLQLFSIQVGIYKIRKIFSI